MNLTDIKAIKAPRKKKKRLGRGSGSGHGKTSGRGSKGFGARSGAPGRRLFEGGQMPLFRRIPKRGFTNAPFKKHIAIVNVGDLACFEPGAVIGPDQLCQAGLIKRVLDGVKILGNGELAINLTVQAHKFSKSAVEKIEAAGGKSEVVA